MLSPLQQDAVQALLAAKHNPTGTRFEHGGMLYAEWTPQGPLYRYLEPTAGGSPDHVRVIDKTLLKRSDVLLGTYHLHLCFAAKDWIYFHQYFSTTDVITAFISGVPEFMLDECTGDVHEFDPKVDKIRDTGIDTFVTNDKCKKIKRHLPTGRVIANIHEIEPPHEIAVEDDPDPCK
jgi:hypothetical protein